MLESFFITQFKTEFALDVVLLLITAILLLFVCYKIVSSKNLLESIILMSAFSLLIGVCYLLMDAPDVTMTEVALGSALSNCVMLNVINITEDKCFYAKKRRVCLSILLCSIFVVLLSAICFDLPEFGSQYAPLHANVTQYYVDNIYNEIQIPSMVAAILGSYRGFDTLGETLVVLIAGLAVFILSSRKSLETFQEQLIVKCILKFIVPYILLYAIYIQLNGKVSPGGGFQAGVIFATGLIGYSFACGMYKLEDLVSSSQLCYLSILGVMIYFFTGIASFLFGEHYLNYYVLNSDPILAQHIGILLIELGVGITVSAVMCLIYISLSRK
ncbi:MAG TPA: DUF4040 domain-containing protein [Candidatus Megaira endosymbiont of Nemacystus decipiens]|nr:DUF4040 domain-containing protein [Candidatus Megaera endosymbiont of Nemacystus decipiens]